MHHFSFLFDSKVDDPHRHEAKLLHFFSIHFSQVLMNERQESCHPSHALLAVN